jgi:hypothetical protein
VRTGQWTPSENHRFHMRTTMAANIAQNAANCHLSLSDGVGRFKKEGPLSGGSGVYPSIAQSSSCRPYHRTRHWRNSESQQPVLRSSPQHTLHTSRSTEHLNSRVSSGKGRDRHRGLQLRAADSGEGDTAEIEKAPAASSVLSFLCPLLKLVSGGDADAPRNRFLEVRFWELQNVLCIVIYQQSVGNPSHAQCEAFRNSIFRTHCLQSENDTRHGLLGGVSFLSRSL